MAQDKSQLKYLNAINKLIAGKTGVLEILNEKFNSNWKKAWESNLSKFLPKNIKKINPDMEWLKIENQKIQIIPAYDKDYPELLKEIPVPPFLLYVRGNKEILNNFSLGVVGTRRLTEYGEMAILKILPEICQANVTIVSGLALGIDTIAHKTALEFKTPTIAVLGTGIDDEIIYPAQNISLAHRIIKEGGAIISEYAPGTHGTPFSFPQRNRIISGLSKGTLVIEADIKSGALITAKYAVDQNRDVFAVPGNILNRTSRGTNLLIKRGAKPILEASDVLEEYPDKIQNSKSKTQTEINAENEVEKKILEVLANSDEPVSIDNIIRVSDLSSQEVSTQLVLMEIKKKVKKVGNKYLL